MYAQSGVASGLTAIEVKVPQGRVAYLLREDLDDAFGRDKNAAPIWRLDVVIGQSRIPLGLTENDVAERYALGLKVRYSLTEIATGKIAVAGDAASEVSYDSASQPYSGIAARQDSQQRAASDVARRIQLALGQWMAQQGRPSSGP
jgi:LPS-assembly lipoprotein